MGKNELTTAAATAVAASLGGIDFGVAQTGFEGMDSSDLSVPFIKVLQKSSPELDDNDTLRPGQFFNTLTLEASESLVFHAAYFHKVFVEWVPLDKGGGLVGVYEKNDPKVLEAIAANGNSTIKLKIGDNDLVETYYLYGLARDGEGNYQRFVMAFKSTMIKPFKDFITQARTLMFPVDPEGKVKGKRSVPLLEPRYRAISIKKENEKGTYYVPSIRFDKEAKEPAITCSLGFNDGAAYDGVHVELHGELVGFADLMSTRSIDVAKASQEKAGNDKDTSDIPF